MYHRSDLRNRKINNVPEDDDDHVDESFPHKTLRLGVVQPGSYVKWGRKSAQDKEEPLWVIENSSRIDLLSPTPGEEEDEEAEPSEEKGVENKESDVDAMNDSTEEDPDAFVKKMKEELETQRNIMKILLKAHKQAKEEWANTPFKLTGPEGRGDTEVLKLLYLVADAPLEDERFSSEQAKEYEDQTPYGDFPLISKCQRVFGNASAISLACATKFQLFGETVQEQMVVGATYSRLRRLKENHKITLNWLFNGAVKEKTKIEWAQSQLLHVILPPAIKEWEQQIRSTKGPFLVESGMTLADLAISDFLDQCSSHVMVDSLLADNLAVSDLLEAVRSCPKLLAHLQEREEE